MAAALVWLVIGAISAFLTSASPGPMNLYAINLAIKRDWRNFFWFAAGISTAEVAVALIASLGIWQQLIDPQVKKIMLFGGGVILCVLGSISFYNLHRAQLSSAAKIVHFERRPVLSQGPSLLCGLLIGSYHPASFAFWVWVAAAGSRYIPTQFSLYALGVGIGNFLWFVLIKEVVNRNATALSQPKILFIQNFVAIAILGIGLFNIISFGLP